MLSSCPQCGNQTELVTVWRGATLPKAQCACCANETVRNMIKNRELDDPFGEKRE
jgi:Zn ribbon nucleic-acid-binding protein